MNREHPGQGHRGRLRDKFLELGLESFRDDEVLELLIALGTPRQDCKQRARDLLARFGSLYGVLTADPEELTRSKGIGPKNIFGLKFVVAVAKRYLDQQLAARESLESCDQALAALSASLGDLTRETFVAILLDTGRKVIAKEEIFRGTLTSAPVYPREVVARALAKGAAYCLVAHNHPGGAARPSQEDQDATRNLYFACRAVGVELLDHVIIGAGDSFSFARNGYMQAYAEAYAYASPQT